MAADTQFKKGKSGNPGGRPKGYVAMRELARSHTREAIETLVDAMRAAEDPKVRCAAACALLDRGWGRPIATLQRTDYVMAPVALPAADEEAGEVVVNGHSPEVGHGR